VLDMLQVTEWLIDQNSPRQDGDSSESLLLPQCPHPLNNTFRDIYLRPSLDPDEGHHRHTLHAYLSLACWLRTRQWYPTTTLSACDLWKMNLLYSTNIFPLVYESSFQSVLSHIEDSGLSCLAKTLTKVTIGRKFVKKRTVKNLCVCVFLFIIVFS